MSELPIVDTRYTQERELSWLRFNERVLDEARDESVPLFERLKFAAIFTSNLDEFFMIRVGSIYDMTLVKKAHVDTKSGLTPAQQLAAILAANEIRSVTVVRMEVPCCGGIQRAAEAAVAASGRKIPLKVSVIGIDGQLRS